MKISVMKRAVAPDAKKKTELQMREKRKKSKSTIFPVCRLKKEKKAKKKTQNII